MPAPSPFRRPKIDDVVRLAGVSRSSVFRFLNGQRLKPAIHEAVELALRRSGYLPSTEAAPIASEILISAPSALGAFRGYADQVEGIMARAAELGIGVQLSLRGLEGEAGREGLARGGVILLGTSIAEEEREIRALQELGTPFVLLNRAIDARGVSYVSPDFRAAAAEAVSHLLAAGKRRIALWDDGSEIFRMQRDKLSGYLDAHEKAGLEAPRELLVSGRAEDLEDAVDRLLGSARPPDAWFAMDDRAAMRVLGRALRRGLKVPGDLAVIGMNDVEAASLSHPSLSSVSLPFFEAGRAATEVLARLAARPCESAIRILLGHTLVARESTEGSHEMRRSPE